MTKKGAVNFTYSQMGADGLDKIADLWSKLTLHHKERAPEVFKDYFDKVTFDTRKKQLLDKAAGGHILVDIATDKNTGNIIGYCVSTVSDKREGELESIYIEKEHRKQNIGDILMKTALAWMDSYGVTRKTIAVAAGNEEALGFYRKYGFHTRVHILIQADSK